MDKLEEHGIDKFNGHAGDEVSVWLQRWTILKATQCWTDAETVNHAVLTLGKGPFRWYLGQAQTIGD